MTKQELFDYTKQYGQEQLLHFYDGLTQEEQLALERDIRNVDFAKMNQLAAEAENTSFRDPADNEITPMDVVKSPKPGTPLYEQYRKAGLEALKKGEVLAITMAGGQGSRLGHEGPKGAFDMGLASHKTLFELQLDGLKEIYEETGTYVHWYIMTSDTNHEATVRFFREHGFFGYPEEKIGFFRQNMIPVTSREGKILLETRSKILRSPDGNGGIFAGMKSAGVLETARAEGAKYVFICGIDNCLVKMCDPLFIGCIVTTGRECVTKTFMKRTADEKAGIYCYRNGRPCVIEYTEVPEEIASLKNEEGEFVYGDANVLNYVFDLEVMAGAVDRGLPYHTAVKKVTRLNENGETVTSETPDSYKFEMFLFDIFGFLKDVMAFRVERTEEFAPIKNKTGVDSALSARDMYMRIHRIPMDHAIVEMDGDEMTRVIWQKIKEKVLLPFVDLNTEYYDLSVQNRDATDDLVTVAAAEATKRLKIAVKCATITPNAKRVEEFGLKKMWKSPNATIRGILDGTVFRKPIVVKGIEPLVKGWKKPIVIARHAYGDIYSAVETRAEKGSVAELTVRKPDGTAETKVIHEFKNSDGIVMAMHNEESSVAGFARACFEFSLSEGMDLWFSAKDTISKVYDHRFKDIFDEIFENEYRERFAAKGITYFYTLVDDAISRVMRSEGGFVWACKNYDGDVFSDMLAASFGSLSMMSSVLVSPAGYFEYEAAHGTIPRHYHQYLAGNPTSTNPVATLFAWTGALAKRGESDGNEALRDFAARVERAAISAIEEGKMTGDLAKITSLPDPVTLDLDGFLEEVASRIYGK